jgi:hypothetical protein
MKSEDISHKRNLLNRFLDLPYVYLVLLSKELDIDLVSIPKDFNRLLLVKHCWKNIEEKEKLPELEKLLKIYEEK